MQEKIQSIEAHLQDFIENKTSKLFGIQSAKTTLAAAISQAIEKKIRVNLDGSLSIPIIFTLIVPESYASEIRENQNFLEQLAKEIMDSADNQGIMVNGEVSITVIPEPSLDDGEFIIEAIWTDTQIDETTTMEIVDDPADQTQIPPKAFLIVEGTRIFPLVDPVVNIGRKLENHLVVDDPRVSRHHAQLRVVDNHFVIFDLDSSGGTYLNSERISQSLVHPGDVISLSGVALVYGQDAVDNPPNKPSGTGSEVTIKNYDPVDHDPDTNNGKKDD